MRLVFEEQHLDPSQSFLKTKRFRGFEINPATPRWFSDHSHACLPCEVVDQLSVGPLLDVERVRSILGRQARFTIDGVEITGRRTFFA
jgi:hypothetical protein